ncbi:MAG: hypothetical protein WA847_12385 [Terriglobales bacterium]
MTLSRGSPAQSPVASLFANPPHGARHDKATLAICEKAAEQGLLTAQLVLAQLYAARRAGPKDLVHTYRPRPCRPRRVLDGYNDSGRNRRRTARVEVFEKCLRATLSELGFQK